MRYKWHAIKNRDQDDTTLPECVKQTGVLAMLLSLEEKIATHFYTTIFFLLFRQKYFIGSSLHRPRVLNTIVDLYPRCNERYIGPVYMVLFYAWRSIIWCCI